MADYQVKATLSAVDKGFTAAMKKAGDSVSSLESTVKSGVGFGVLTGVGIKAFDAITNGIGGMVSELNSSNKAWKTFDGNMQILGKSSGEIAAVKKELQDYATQTTYNASDMASTYSQLAAVGVNSAEKLVKGFGGIAAASENPKQAMKTLSQQAVQMAAKPTVAWEDFKLMLEQTPAGIAAVAKEMGMTTDELVKNVQSGEVATNDFFSAIERVGTSDSFTKLSTQYKGVDEALAGLTETIGVKFGPAFEIASQVAVDCISKVIDMVGQLDSAKIEEFATKFANGMATAFDFIINNWGTISKVGGTLAAIGVAFKAYKGLEKIAPFMDVFGKGLGKVASSVAGNLAAKLFGTAAAQTAVGTASAGSAKQVLAAGAAFMALGAGVALIAGGFYILASASTMLAGAGAPAIAIMIGMTAAIALLAVGAAAIGPALTAGAVGFVAFGAAITLVGVGALLAAVALQVVAGVLPTVVQYGASGAVAIAQLGLAMMTFAAGAALAGVASLALGAGLLIVGVGAVAAAAGVMLLATATLLLGTGVMLAATGVMMLGTGLPLVASGGMMAGAALMMVGTAALMVVAGSLAAAVGMAALGIAAVAAGLGITGFGLAVTLASGGVIILAGSLAMVNGVMGSIANRASEASSSLSAMVTSVNFVDSALDALGDKAQSAMDSLISAFNNAEGEAKSAGQAIGDNVKNGVESGLKPLPNIASSTMASVMAVLNSSGGASYSAGYNIGAGLASGMYAALGEVAAAADALVAEADRAIRAKAQIHSPSKLTAKEGGYMGEGLAVGMLDKLKLIKDAAKKLISIPSASPTISFGGISQMNDRYGYGQVIYVNAEVTSVMDGRKVGYGSARYVKEKNDFDEKRKNRIGGIV